MATSTQSFVTAFYFRQNGGKRTGDCLDIVYKEFYISTAESPLILAKIVAVVF